MNRSLRNRGILITIISTLGFSTYPILGKFIFAGGANLNTTLLIRFTLGAVFFWFFTFLKEGIPKLKPSLWIILIAMGGIGYASMSGLYLSSVLFIPASLAALILYTYPMLVAVFSVLAKQEKFSWSKMIGVLISSVGLILILGLNFKGVNLTGILLAFGASLFYSLYIVAGSFVLREISPLLSTAVISTAAALTYALFGIGNGFTLELSPSTWLGILGIAFFCTILAMLTFFYGIKMIGPTAASVISSLEPILTFCLAAFLFQERLTLIQGLGGLFVILGGLKAVSHSEKASSLLIENSSQKSYT